MGELRRREGTFSVSCDLYPDQPAPTPCASKGSPIYPFVVQPWQVQLGSLPPALILDLREPDRFARGHLEGAVNLPYGRFQDEALDQVDPGRPVLVVDPGGARAAEMATWLRARGVSAGYLEGGYAAWTGLLVKSPI